MNIVKVAAIPDRDEVMQSYYIMNIYLNSIVLLRHFLMDFWSISDSVYLDVVGETQSNLRRAL